MYNLDLNTNGLLLVLEMPFLVWTFFFALTILFISFVESIKIIQIIKLVKHISLLIYFYRNYFQICLAHFKFLSTVAMMSGLQRNVYSCLGIFFLNKAYPVMRYDEIGHNVRDKRYLIITDEKCVQNDRSFLHYF